MDRKPKYDWSLLVPCVLIAISLLGFLYLVWIGSIDRIFSQYPQENWPQNFNLANMLRTRRLLHLSTLIFHRIVENAVDYRARIYVSLYSFMPCSSLNHDRSTGLYLSVVNCDTLMHRQMPRS